MRCAEKGDGMKIHILGAAGWIPGRNETSCVMVEEEDQLFLLDAGTGISNLRNCREIFDRYDTVNLVLSHYHLDHTVGLIYLDPYVRGKHLRIFGPGKMAYSRSTEEYLHALLRSEFFSRSIDRFSDDVRIADFPGETFSIGKTVIQVSRQIHSAPSFRIAVGGRLIYATDTAFDPLQWKDVYAPVLLHECWDIRSSDSSRHTSLLQLKNELPREQFGRIVLIHQNPAWDDSDRRTIAGLISGTNIILAKDGMTLTV